MTTSSSIGNDLASRILSTIWWFHWHVFYLLYTFFSSIFHCHWEKSLFCINKIICWCPKVLLNCMGSKGTKKTSHGCTHKFHSQLYLRYFFWIEKNNIMFAIVCRCIFLVMKTWKMVMNMRIKIHNLVGTNHFLFHSVHNRI